MVWKAIAFRLGLDRAARDISRAEIAGLIQAKPHLATSEDKARDLANLMGIARLTADTRAYLEHCLESDVLQPGTK